MFMLRYYIGWERLHQVLSLLWTVQEQASLHIVVIETFSYDEIWKFKKNLSLRKIVVSRGDFFPIPSCLPGQLLQRKCCQESLQAAFSTKLLITEQYATELNQKQGHTFYVLYRYVASTYTFIKVI